MHVSGSTTDVSALLRFYFWQPFYYKCSEASFPSDSKEALGHIVGISEHCGHALTYKILTSDSEHIIYRSLLRPATQTPVSITLSSSSTPYSGQSHVDIINRYIKHGTSVIYDSLLRPVTPTDANLRAGMFGGEQDIHNVSPIIKSRQDFDIMDESKPTDTAASASPPPVINPEYLIGSSFLMDNQEDGQQYRGRIVQLIEDHESMVEDNPTRIKF
jgi:hypothetical protein